MIKKIRTTAAKDKVKKKAKEKGEKLKGGVMIVDDYCWKMLMDRCIGAANATKAKDSGTAYKRTKLKDSKDNATKKKRKKGDKDSAKGGKNKKKAKMKTSAAKKAKTKVAKTKKKKKGKKAAALAVTKAKAKHRITPTLHLKADTESGSISEENRLKRDIRHKKAILQKEVRQERKLETKQALAGTSELIVAVDTDDCA